MTAKRVNITENSCNAKLAVLGVFAFFTSYALYAFLQQYKTATTAPFRQVYFLLIYNCFFVNSWFNNAKLCYITVNYSDEI